MAQKGIFSHFSFTVNMVGGLGSRKGKMSFKSLYARECVFLSLEKQTMLPAQLDGRIRAEAPKVPEDPLQERLRHLQLGTALAATPVRGSCCANKARL